MASSEEEEWRYLGDARGKQPAVDICGGALGFHFNLHTSEYDVGTGWVKNQSQERSPSTFCVHSLSRDKPLHLNPRKYLERVPIAYSSYPSAGLPYHHIHLHADRK